MPEPPQLCSSSTLSSFRKSLRMKPREPVHAAHFDLLIPESQFPATHGVSTVSETATLKSHGYQDSQRMSTCHPLLSSCLCRDSQTSSLTSASARWVIFPARPAALPPPQHACVCVCVSRIRKFFKVFCLSLYSVEVSSSPTPAENSLSEALLAPPALSDGLP